MLKNKLIMILGMTTVVATPTTAAVIVLANNNQTAEKNTSHDRGVAGSIIDKPDDFREIEDLTTESSENDGQWSPHYRKIDWASIIDAKAEWAYARINGWTDIERWRLYTWFAREKQSPDIHSTFGAFSTPPGDGWFAWHHARGGELSTSYSDGAGSAIVPMWDRAHLEEYNNINNDIKWYLYDRGGSIFGFDQNNILNAWQRLIHLERIVKTSISEIRAEEGFDSREEDANPVQRNHVMVNGKFIPVANLSAFENYYYVRDNSADDWVRDSHGWRVVVTDENPYAALTKVINPEKQGVYSGVTGQRDARPFSNLDYSKFKYEDANNYAKFIDKNRHEVIEYPNGYSINFPHALENNIVSLTGLDNQGNECIKMADATDKDLWSGLYQVVMEKDSFVQIVEDQNTLLPQEMWTTDYVTRYGAKGPWTYSHPWNGGGYNFLWIEDGKGGHKVWKDLYNLRLKGYENEGGKQRPSGNAGYPANAGVPIRTNWKIYGNYQYIWAGTETGKEWFEEQTERYADAGWS